MYGRDSSAPSTFMVTSLLARGAAKRSPERNWELMSPRIVTSPPLRGPLTSTSNPLVSEIIRAEAPRVLMALTSGSNGLLASLGLPDSLTVFREFDAIAVRNLRVAPDSPQSMGLLVDVGLPIPREIVRVFLTTTLAPSLWIPSRVRWVSSHCNAPSIIDSPSDNREASNALWVYALEPGALTFPVSVCGPLILTLKSRSSLS